MRFAHASHKANGFWQRRGASDKRTSLRVILPSLEELAPETVVPYLQFNGEAVVESQGQASLAEIGRFWPMCPAQVVLQTRDVALACVQVPPLSGARLASAVATAAEPLILGDLSQVILAHGPRASDGSMPLAWVERELFEVAWRTMADCGIALTGCYPGVLTLPITDAGWTFCDAGAELLVRTGRDTGFVLPYETVASHAAQADQVLPLPPHALESKLAHDASLRLRWVDPVPGWWQHPTTGEVLAAVDSGSRHTGLLPSWAITLSPGVGLDARTWRAPLAWIAAAAAAFVLGLNLYAMRLSHEGQSIRARMADRVQSVFPQAGAVKEPLRQARELRDRQRSALQSEQAETFVSLLRSAADSFAWGDGQVRTLGYADGVLTVGLLEGKGTASSAEQPEWAKAAQEAGLQVVQAEPGRWRIQVARENGKPSEPGTAQ